MTNKYSLQNQMVITKSHETYLSTHMAMLTLQDHSYKMWHAMPKVA